MKQPSVFLICTMLFAISSAADLYDDYDHYASLDELENYKLYWSVNNDEKEVSFAVEVRTTGWVGFGISSGNGKMKGSDLVIGWVKDCKGYLTDRYADGYSVPKLDSQQDYHLTGFSEKDGTTILKFKRKIDTCDKRDRKIMGGTSKVVYSYHNKDPKSPMDLQMHSVKGSRTLMLLNAFKQPISDKGLKYFDVLNSNVTVPPNDTTYWCHPVKMPKLDKKYHIVKYAPLVNKGNEGLVHHIIVYMCSDKFNESFLDHGNICEHPNMPRDIKKCKGESMLAAWAIGGKAFVYPNHTGFPIGTPDSPAVVLMETHYDNPEEKTGLLDSSGLRFYYDEPRKYDAGIMMTGWSVGEEMMIPPGQQDWLSTGYCAKECTEEGLSNTKLDGGGINVFSIVLHTHLAGRKVKVRHVRKNKELDTLAEDDNYDFNFQEAHSLPKEVKILPGDDIMTECTYNTMDRKQRTVGGESTRQEMCLSFLMYYPVTNLAQCLSKNNGYYWFLYEYGFTKNFTHYMKSFPVQWNKTMANDLKTYYKYNENVTVFCRGKNQWLPGLVYTEKPKAKVLYPLKPDNDTCIASGVNGTTEMDSGKCKAVSGAWGMEISLISTAVLVVVGVLGNCLVV